MGEQAFKSIEFDSDYKSMSIEKLEQILEETDIMRRVKKINAILKLKKQIEWLNRFIVVWDVCSPDGDNNFHEKHIDLLVRVYENFIEEENLEPQSADELKWDLCNDLEEL